MKILLLLSLAFLGNRLVAGQAAVFGEKDVYVLDSGAAVAGPPEPDRQAFFQGYRADLKRQTPLEKALDLISPPEWGKTVSAATRGRIRFHPSFAGGFACHVALDSLLPNHDYILTLNGNPAKAGNDLLISAVPGNPQERYYDFLIVTTDANGRYNGSLGVFLKRGNYDVRFYVKDTGDFKIVLYRDYFPFTVE
jgi:hypothetical protein